MQQSLAGWRLYLRQPIFPASAAYIMLFFNAVLGPGSLMTAFLASKGLSGTGSALFRCFCRLAPPCVGLHGYWWQLETIPAGYMAAGGAVRSWALRGPG